MKLTAENYNTGFLVDDEVVGGVAEHPEKPGQFVAFILRPEAGEYLGYQAFDNLEAALATINQVERDWVFEAASDCKGGCGEHEHEHEHDGEHGGGGCGSGGGCGGCGCHD